MVAVYPSAIKNFSYRQDYTELVEAADVNTAYDEIRAVQSTLGTYPQYDTIDGTLNKWSTVGARVSAVRAGVSKPFCNVAAHNFLVNYGTALNPSWTSKTWDTHSMWGGGTSLVCPRDGVYTFDVYMRWHRDGYNSPSQQPEFNRNGKLEIGCIPVGSDTFLTNQSDFFAVGFQDLVHQSASITMPWVKGTAVVMQVYQTVLHGAPITATALMSITYHRDPPTTNNL